MRKRIRKILAVLLVLMTVTVGASAGTPAATTASAFTRGQMAVSGAAGLVLGIVGSAVLFSAKRRKEKGEA